jgi:predicted Zn-dependent protease
MARRLWLRSKRIMAELADQCSLGWRRFSLVLVSLLFILSAIGPGIANSAPPLQVHPLPPTLATWEDTGNSGDYFDQIQSVEVGALLWSTFPVRIRLDLSNAQAPRQDVWVGAVTQAIVEWNHYLPLLLVESDKEADITIRRAPIPLQRRPDGTLGRVRFAQTQYEVYQRDRRWRHRMQITLSPNQADRSLLAAARHELGHALGLWGHSPLSTDVMFPSQVGNPPAISSRDVNTLKRVYEQPTRLGWPISLR